MKIPSGNSGKALVSELSRLFRAFGEVSSLESIALFAASILPCLLLQRPHTNSKDSTNRSILERRLKIWKEGKFRDLLEEGRLIQSRRRKYKHKKVKNSEGDDSTLSRSFSNMIFRGKVDAALKLITKHEKGGLLHLNEEVSGNSVKSILRDKHPDCQSICSDALLPPSDSPQSLSIILSRQMRQLFEELHYPQKVQLVHQVWMRMLGGGSVRRMGISQMIFVILCLWWLRGYALILLIRNC